MRFRRLGPKGQETPVVMGADGRYLDLSPITRDITGDFLENNGIEKTALALREGSLTEIVEASSMRVGAPISRPPAVICIGQNYAAHAAESGSEVPSVPLVFFKHPNTVVGPYDNLLRPPHSRKLDWEVELGVVIGTRARYLTG